MLNSLIRILVRLLLRLRYKVEARGLKEIRADGNTKILFLPNHPALIDPVIMLSVLHKDFEPFSVADEYQIDRPLLRWLSSRFRVKPLPDVARSGTAAVQRIRGILQEITQVLKNGNNVLLYPAGHIKRQSKERVGSTSAVHSILKGVPEARVVLVRQNGLWGSSFSWASGGPPQVFDILNKMIKYSILNGFFFVPRRPVIIEFFEPDDFPRHADRMTMNRYLEDFYNEKAWPNMYVPYVFWDKRDIFYKPDPEYGGMQGDIQSVPIATKNLVIDYLKNLTGIKSIREDQSLTYDLGLDSLAMMEVVLWLEREFGFPQGNIESLRTVGDVMLAAIGKGLASSFVQIRRPGKNWFAEAEERLLTIAEGETVTAAFLNKAGENPGKSIVADQISGGKTYREMIMGILLLRSHIRKLPGNFIGIMLPASVGATIVYLTVLFSRKTPVMVNWTVGSRNMTHSLDGLGVQKVITARTLVSRLKGQGVDLDTSMDRFVFLEDIRKQVSFFSKIIAVWKSYFDWSSLRNVEPTQMAAVLFTSGSESLPKTVPLSHDNLLSNIRDVPLMVAIQGTDKLIGILPPFHSFGITVTVILPLVMGLPTVYYPNPTEGAILAGIVEEYKVTLMVGTPTFLQVIARAAAPRQLQSLRIAISGAEKCPEGVYRLLEFKCPNMKILEGYGVTECSPVVSVNRERDPKPFTIGHVMPSLEHVLLDIENGRPVEIDRPGMLLVRGPSVFNGYLNYSGPSPFINFEGKLWYGTGDLLLEDRDGFLTFKGRLKRFIKLGGEMVSLPAIEEALVPNFTEDADERPVVAVESTPNEENPELVLFTTKDTDREAVNAYIRKAGLSPLHNIRRIIKLGELPVLGTGKVDYQALKRLLSC